MPTDQERLLQILSDANPWWSGDPVPDSLAPPYRRRDFFVLRRKLEGRPIVALAGPRQVGKTTLMYQLLRDLLKAGVPRNQILFASFDLPGLALAAEDPLNDVIRIFEERILQVPFRDVDGPVYILLDEVTKARNWHRDLKGWFDFRYPLRFLVSSSSNSELESGAAASLAGRVSTHLLLSWKFVDVMSLRTGDFRANDGYLEARAAIVPAIRQRKPELLHSALTGLRPRSPKRRVSISSTLEWYLLVDGYPELAQGTDLLACARRLDEYVKLTLAHDLYRYHEIRSSTRVLEDILSLIASQSGGLVSYSGLAEPVGLEQRTLVEYLDFLEEAFLISRASFYSRSRQTRLRKQKKVYVPNPGLLNVLRGRLDRSVLASPEEMGAIAESVVHEHAKRLAFNLGAGVDPEAFYWRNRRGQEVDVIVNVANQPLPIEVKYRAEPRQHLEGIRSFLEEKDVPFGVVVTKDLLELDPPLVFVPLADFLMLA
jgi:uncharacterized protein